MSCLATLDFSLINPALPSVQVSDVPGNETVQLVASHTAGLLGVGTDKVSFLREDTTGINPTTILSTLASGATNGEVVLKVIPREFVGGRTTSNLPDGPLAGFGRLG